MTNEIYSRSAFELALEYLRYEDNPEAEAIWREGLNEEEQALLGTYNFVQSTIALRSQRIMDSILSEFTQMASKLFRSLGMLR